MKKKQNGSGITSSKPSQSKTRSDILPIEEPIDFQGLPVDVQEIILKKGLLENNKLSYTEVVQLMVKNNPYITQYQMNDLLVPENITITSTPPITPEYIPIINEAGVQTTLSKRSFKKLSDYIDHINKLQDNDIEKIKDIIFEGRGLSVKVYLTPGSNKGSINIQINDTFLPKTLICSLVLDYMYFKGKPLHASISSIKFTMYLSKNTTTNDEGVINITNILDMVVSTLWLKNIFKTISWVNTVKFNEIGNIDIVFITEEGNIHVIDFTKFNKYYPNSELIPNLQKLLKTMEGKLLKYYPKKIVRQTRSTITTV